MNPLNYIFDDMRPEKAKLLRLAPAVFVPKLPEEVTEPYRDIPSAEDGPRESISTMHNYFPNNYYIVDKLEGTEDREVFLRYLDKLPDFQLNRSLVEAIKFLPSLAWRNQKTTLAVFLLTACVSLFVAFPVLEIVTAFFNFLYGLVTLAAMLVGVIVAVLVLIFLGDQVEKVFRRMMRARPGDKVLSLLMPKWDRHRNKMLLP